MPLLSANDIRLVGIGVEENGLGYFLQKQYFLGELYLDITKESYQALGYRRFNWFTLVFNLMSRKTISSLVRGIVSKIPWWNLLGDGLQNGGVIIVKKGGGKILMSYKQKDACEHASNSDVLKCLGLDEPVVESELDK